MKPLVTLAIAATTIFLSPPRANADSRVVFYDRPAKWLFDLIKQPTSIRHFNIGREFGIVGATQVELTKNIECTIHGKTKENPKSSAEASLALCTVRAESVWVHYPERGGGSFTFDGETAKLVFDLLPKTDHSYPRTDDFGGRGSVTGTQTMKSFGQSGTDGIDCTHLDYIDENKADSTSCAISWRK